MRLIDASSIVYGWDNYPVDQFPSFWVWATHEIAAGDIQIFRVALDEVGNTSPECAKWLRTAGIQPLPVTNEILTLANTIKSELGIADDDYHAKGA